ncbi:unnamed protein product [Allacma fusca]|uniref:Uncharacterized protein n=1 Tax=Allacma fusca TaxID=39272 RepID=A0A8J2L3Y7_9HEXA|nr:unnamed protein product [Allacma fusca]
MNNSNFNLKESDFKDSGQLKIVTHLFIRRFQSNLIKQINELVRIRRIHTLSMEEATKAMERRNSPPRNKGQRLRPRQHEEGCPKRDASSAPPVLKSPSRKQVPFLLKRENKNTKQKSNLPWAFSSSTIDVRRQSSAPPEFSTRSVSSTKPSSSSMRSANSISNIFSDFGREMQRKFASRPKSVDQTHFSTARGSVSMESRNSITSGRNSFGISRGMSSTSRSISTLNILDIDEIPADIPAPITTHPAPTSKQALGMYLNADEITIGTIPEGTTKPEVLIQTKAVIAFLEDKISVGKNAPTAASFSAYDLIKSAPKTKHSFKWGSDYFTFSSEEILAIFFEKLIEDMQALKEVSAAVDSIVLTFEFFVTSLEKERVKQSVKIAGVHSVRVLSSTVTTAVTYAHDMGYYKTNVKASKLFIVVHPSANSFSMAVVQVSPHCISTKCCIGSENLDECKEDTFISGHAQMFSDGNASLTPEQEASVWLAYEGAVQQLLKGIPESKISTIVGVTGPRNEFQLNHILERIFGDKEMNIRNSEGPLFGACIVAESKLLPKDIQVHDASRTNLLLMSGSKKWRLDCKNRKYVPGNVFTLDIPVPAQGTSLILCEEFSRGKLSDPVGQYKISASMQPLMKNYDILVRCFVSVDQDGVYSLGPHFSKEIAVKTFIRTDALTGDISLEIRRLKVSYDNANYLRRSELTRQEAVEEAVQDEPRDEIRIWASDAERLYIDTLTRFNFQGKSPEELKEEHEKAKTETLRRFKTNCEENGVDPNNWMSEVETKLEAVFQDVRDFLTNSKNKFKDWLNKKFPKSKANPATESGEGLGEGSEEASGVTDDMILFKTNDSSLDTDKDGNNNPCENDYDVL